MCKGGERGKRRGDGGGCAPHQHRECFKARLLPWRRRFTKPSPTPNTFPRPTAPQGGQLTPIDLIVEERFHRAAPGGMGGTKAAGNYSPVSGGFGGSQGGQGGVHHAGFTAHQAAAVRVPLTGKTLKHCPL